jgi:hypothetical protein
MLPPPRTSTASAGVPEAFGYFNRMKQEFVWARYFYYEVSRRGDHIFRIATSCSTTRSTIPHILCLRRRFVQRFALHPHSWLPRNPRQVSFRSVWYEPRGSAPRPLLSQFAMCRNWPLRGLFLLSNEIRNYLEHKYLQIHRMSAQADPGRYVHSISETDFTGKTMRLLKLVRAALTLRVARRSQRGA